MVLLDLFRQQYAELVLQSPKQSQSAAAWAQKPEVQAFPHDPTKKFILSVKDLHLCIYICVDEKNKQHRVRNI